MGIWRMVKLIIKTVNSILSDGSNFQKKKKKQNAEQYQTSNPTLHNQKNTEKHGLDF